VLPSPSAHSNSSRSAFETRSTTRARTSRSPSERRTTRASSPYTALRSERRSGWLSKHRLRARISCRSWEVLEVRLLSLHWWILQGVRADQIVRFTSSNTQSSLSSILTLPRWRTTSRSWSYSLTRAIGLAGCRSCPFTCTIFYLRLQL
jgi:hypothetical protein